MCTVSWLHTPSGYQLLCNRDERHIRKPALGPMIRNLSGVRVIAPVDGYLGGAWIAVNEAGLAFSLVNRYVCGRCSPESNRKPPSRGLVLMRLADCRSLEEAQSRFDRLDLGPYPPFTIVHAGAEQAIHVAALDGPQFSDRMQRRIRYAADFLFIRPPERRSLSQAALSNVGGNAGVRRCESAHGFPYQPCADSERLLALHASRQRRHGELQPSDRRRRCHRVCLSPDGALCPQNSRRHGRSDAAWKLVRMRLTSPSPQPTIPLLSGTLATGRHVDESTGNSCLPHRAG